MSPLFGRHDSITNEIFVWKLNTFGVIALADMCNETPSWPSLQHGIPAHLLSPLFSILLPLQVGSRSAFRPTLSSDNRVLSFQWKIIPFPQSLRSHDDVTADSDVIKFECRKILELLCERFISMC
ncbi:hypothetical protein TNCT_543041 [Trichonephila clavata]|uniref:Uncharacterized protein n=1 Tax=Trichonephila clavata TaxID=2740835 RepID=A0A8X6HM82_TRICU|nr:hypothetical protein TNCT_543041 [Trichonephila clavata]